MATIKQFVVVVNDVTDKDNPFIAETHIIRAKSKSEAADAIWQRLAETIIEKDGRMAPEEYRQFAAKHYRLTIELKRSITAVGYQERAARDAARAKARKKAAAKKAAAGKVSGANGKVRTHKAA